MGEWCGAAVASVETKWHAWHGQPARLATVVAGQPSPVQLVVGETFQRVLLRPHQLLELETVAALQVLHVGLGQPQGLRLVQLTLADGAPLVHHAHDAGQQQDGHDGEGNTHQSVAQDLPGRGVWVARGAVCVR